MKIDTGKALEDGLSLFRQSKWHKSYNVDDIHRYLISPLKHNRIRLYYRQGMPVGLVTWCWLSKENGQKFLDNSYYITEDDYISDKNEEFWAIELIAPHGDVRQIMRLIREEHEAVCGRNEKVNWRRLHAPNVRHTRKLKT